LARELRLGVEELGDGDGAFVYVAAVEGGFEVGVVAGGGVDEGPVAYGEVEDDLAGSRVEEADDLLGDGGWGEELAEFAFAFVDGVGVVVAVVAAFEAVEAA